MKASLTNANPSPAKVRVTLGGAGEGRIEGMKGVRVKDGSQIVEFSVAANSTREVRWTYAD